MCDKEKMIEEIMKKLRALPGDEQKGACLLLNNIELADEMCRGEKMTQEAVDEFIKSTREKKDYVGLALILCKNEIDKFEK